MTDSSAEDLQFNYIEHLQLEKLLTAQKFVSPHPEESVFVIMHQSYELWFRQVIHDLERIIAMLESDAVAQATWLIQRLGRIFQALDTQLGILERRCCTARSKSLTSLCRLQSHPAQYVSGIPSAAILLSISHPIRCSTRCLANVRARISGPMIAL